VARGAQRQVVILDERALRGEGYLLAQLGVEARVAPQMKSGPSWELAGGWGSAPGHVGVDDQKAVWLCQGARTCLVRS
jgi:hypothetical protein